MHACVHACMRARVNDFMLRGGDRRQGLIARNSLHVELPCGCPITDAHALLLPSWLPCSLCGSDSHAPGTKPTFDWPACDAICDAAARCDECRVCQCAPATLQFTSRMSCHALMGKGNKEMGGLGKIREGKGREGKGAGGCEVNQCLKSGPVAIDVGTWCAIFCVDCFLSALRACVHACMRPFYYPQL